MDRLWALGVISLAACGFRIGASGDGSSDASGDAPGDAQGDASTDAPPTDGDTGPRRRVITVDHTRVAGDVTGFPVWVVLDDAQLGARARADGSDLYFRQGGTPLPYELQRWDKASGHLEAWVRMTLADTTATVFELHYGGAPGHAANPAQVFGGVFLAVWHLDDTLATTAIAEARGAATGTATGGLAAAASVAGKLGRGIRFDGVDDAIQFTSPLTGAGAHTFSAWVTASAPAGNSFSSILTIGDPSGDHARWWHTSFPDVSMGFYNANDFASNVNIDGAQALVHWVYDPNGNRSRLYRDGQLVATSPQLTAPVDTQTTAGHIGNAPAPFGAGGTNPCPLAGVLDEVRIYASVRSANWIATEYANQSSPQTFYAVGPELPP